jgi:hypothetical protein
MGCGGKSPSQSLSSRPNAPLKPRAAVAPDDAEDADESRGGRGKGGGGPGTKAGAGLYELRALGDLKGASGLSGLYLATAKKRS